jgi:hypothetical protein
MLSRNFRDLYKKHGRGKRVKEYSTISTQNGPTHTPDIPGKTVNVPQYCAARANPAFPFTPWSSQLSLRVHHIPLCYDQSKN